MMTGGGESQKLPKWRWHNMWMALVLVVASCCLHLKTKIDSCKIPFSQFFLFSSWEISVAGWVKHSECSSQLLSSINQNYDKQVIPPNFKFWTWQKYFSEIIFTKFFVKSFHGKHKVAQKSKIRKSHFGILYL